jgi:hypothetical protein
MGMSHRDETISTEAMTVTVAEWQGRSREGEAERSRKQMCKCHDGSGVVALVLTFRGLAALPV